eukprot:GHVS01065342.1.p1 GENE.GHVS01065342.1~~GHVS01065342.1.p1  ORF type:complete len:369 (-),score=47.98 GHVS01065342.1:236-1342(-)
MFSLLLHLYEVACLMWFWQLMVDLLDGPDNAVEILSSHPPRLIWNVPPLCFLSYFMKHRYFSSGDIVWSWWLVAQYGVLSVVNVLLAVISEKTKERFQYGTVLSLLLCMWGLFVIFRASRKESREFRLPGKFLCLKLIVVVIKGSEILFRIDALIFASSGLYSKFVMSQIWASFVPGVIALPFTLLAMRVFPSKDIHIRHVKHTTSKSNIRLSDVTDSPKSVNDESVRVQSSGVSSVSPTSTRAPCGTALVSVSTTPTTSQEVLGHNRLVSGAEEVAPVDAPSTRRETQPLTVEQPDPPESPVRLEVAFSPRAHRLSENSPVHHQLIAAAERLQAPSCDVSLSFDSTLDSSSASQTTVANRSGLMHQS